MARHLAILSVAPDDRIAKYRDFATEAEAQAHVDEFISDFPDAFAAPEPGGGLAFTDWLAVGKTVILSPPDRSVEIRAEAKQRANERATLIMAELFVDLIEALIAKGTIAAADFPAETRTQYQTLKTLVEDWRAL